jgi:hypothetical protein
MESAVKTLKAIIKEAVNDDEEKRTPPRQRTPNRKARQLQRATVEITF